MEMKSHLPTLIRPRLEDDENPAKSPLTSQAWIIEDGSAGPSPFSNEEWEEWMRWDGVATALAPQQPVRKSCESTDSNQLSVSALDNEVLSARSSSESVEWLGYGSNSKKRKSLAEISGTSAIKDGHNSAGPQVVKRSHTIIEKRYRTNLNQKITALRESVPSLRDNDKNPEDLGGLIPASKLNKATILSKAIEYIHHLERRNKLLEEENVHLRRRAKPGEPVSQDNKEVARGQVPQSQIDMLSFRSMETAEPGSPISTKAPKGLIPVPDSIKNLQSLVHEEHYAGRFRNRYDSAQPSFHEMDSTGQRGSSRSKFFGKLMVGSLAGLLIMEGFSENDGDDDATGGRGLWALPISPFYSLFRFILTIRTVFLPSAYVTYFSPMFRLLLVFSVLAFAMFLYLFSSRPTSSRKNPSVTPTTASSIASPIEVRQKAWLTSIQTVWVPRHRMLPELVALHLEAMRYILRQLIGWPGYSWLTGRTDDAEIARVRAWDIAIDAQLTGGDSEVSKSRLVLTIWASGTLPSTPSRLMLKALHIRVLLWEASKSRWSIWYFLHKAAARLARQQWLMAQKIQKTSSSLHSYLSDDRETLPEHLVELLKLDPDELFTPLIVQRAYNLAWNRSTGEDAEGEDVGIDVVVEDSAIRSPLDALAAWASSSILRQTLLAWYDDDGILEESYKQRLDTALRIAPPASSAYVRALASKAVFFETDRGSNITKLTKDLLPLKLSKGSEAAYYTTESALVDSCVPEPVRNDVYAAMQCAAAIGLLTSSNRKPNADYEAVNRLAVIYVNANSLSLLGFAATHQLMLVLASENGNRESTRRLEYIKSELQIWMNGSSPKDNRLDAQARTTICAALDKLVIKIMPERRLSEISNDTGYESMSDQGK